MYLYNDFVEPGKHYYYIVSSDGISKYTYKSYFLAFIKPRHNDIEIRQIPNFEAYERKEREELQNAIQVKQEYEDKLR